MVLGRWVPLPFLLPLSVIVSLPYLLPQLRSRYERGNPPATVVQAEPSTYAALLVLSRSGTGMPQYSGDSSSGGEEREFLSSLGT